MSDSSAALNLRTAERFLLAPPLTGKFGAAEIAVCDISAKGARFRHQSPLEMGKKSMLMMAVDGRPAPVSMEAVIVWTMADSMTPGRFVSGVRTYAPVDVVNTLIAQLKTSHRTNRIEELRSTDRFLIAPALEAAYGGVAVLIENICARGARIECARKPLDGASAPLELKVAGTDLTATVRAQIVWSSVKAITGGDGRSYRAGLMINEKPELMRLAIGQLCESNRATLDTQSLRLKLKIIRARARQFAPSYRSIEESGIPAEQYLLIQGVREELRLNPEEALHWYRRARLIINDPTTRTSAPHIADHPDALAVWEYLDRSIDPTIVGRAFEIPRR
jgi:hypothetical protein